MSLMTNWGYTLTDVTTLTDMLTVAEFDTLTAGKYAGDVRTQPDIKAASSAVRNYCGWHVYPSSACKAEFTFYSPKITETINGILIQLPAVFVSEVTAVSIGGEAHTAFVLETNGVLRLFDVYWSHLPKSTPIVVYYTAGVPDELMDGLKELIANRVTHALASSAGVQSETAGGVSITYNATWTNTSRATALADDNKEVLQPFRVQGVF